MSMATPKPQLAWSGTFGLAGLAVALAVSRVLYAVKLLQSAACCKTGRAVTGRLLQTQN